MLTRSQITSRITRALQGARDERLHAPQIIQRGKAVRRGGGGEWAPHVAFSSTAAPTSTIVACYIDEDGVGDTVDVEVKIHGGGNLNNAVPLLSDGEWFYVYYDLVTTRWRNLTTFIGGTTNCAS